MVDGADDSRGMFPALVGEQLAAERVRQKLELSDIAARSRIPLRHLEAIETGKHTGLPAIPYSAGFVKSYANILGLDGQALSRAFRDQVGEERRAYFEPEAYEPVDPSRVPSRLLAMIALGVALLLGMGYLLLRFEGDNSDLAKLAADTVPDARPVAARPGPPPPAAAPVVPAGPVAPTGPITIAANEDVWIKISEADGSRTYIMDVLPAGQSFIVPDTAVDPVLRTGRPQVMKVLIGDTVLPPVGEPDRVVRAYSLKRDALVAIATAALAKPGTESGPANYSDPAAPAVSSGSAGPISESGQRPRP
ncbi:MAG: RodZ domain-containing protein [Rhizorhabdus sp.]